VDEGNRASEVGKAALRLCNLVAQSPSSPEGDFKKEMERELTGRETEPCLSRGRFDREWPG